MSDYTILKPEEIVGEIRLSLVDGVGSILARRLLEQFGSVSAIFTASLHDLTQVPGIGSVLAKSILSPSNIEETERVIKYCHREGITLIAQHDERYPANLREIPDPPVLLYYRGQVVPQDNLAIAVVGTRSASFYGKKQTRLLTQGLAAAGFTIISGLARGIDSAAHLAALEVGGRTIAVLGSGVDNIFPPENLNLARSIGEQGAVVSEFPPLAEAFRGNFPRRNRIVSGMSLGVLVVESPRHSGSLITARMAMEQNREVFAVPGPIDQENSRGTHRLIKDGAVLVESVDDIIELLSPLAAPVIHPGKPAPIHTPLELQLNERESQLLTFITSTPILVDQIISQSGLPTHQVLAALSVLEFRRIIRRGEGNTVYRL